MHPSAIPSTTAVGVDDLRAVMRASMAAEAHAVDVVTAGADLAAMESAARRIIAAPLTVTCASGSTGFAAAKFAHTLCCVERPAKFMPPHEAIHGGLGCVTGESVVVMASRGGKTAELLPIMDVVLAKGACLVVVTENTTSRLAEAADVVLPMRIERESDPLGLMATSSFLATVAIFDALVAGIIHLTGFSREQFGLIHPGGAVGELLSRGPAASTTPHIHERQQ